MRIEFREDDKLLRSFVAKTSRGFTKKQKAQITAFRKTLRDRKAVLSYNYRIEKQS